MATIHTARRVLLTAALVLLASVASACTPALVATAVDATVKTTTKPAPVIGAWRGVFAPHGWVAVPRPRTEMRAAVTAVRDAGFGVQLLNVGSLDATGTIPASVHPALADWVATSRSVAPTMKVMAWVNGSEAANVDRTATHAATARWLAGLVTQYGLDGIVLDLEPFRQDNRSYLSLLQTLRAAMPATWIGVSAPADGQWSSAFISEVAGPADGLLPMHYDTSLTSRSRYSARVAAEHGRYAAAVGRAAAVLPVLPAYARNQWHDPAVEDVSAAVAGITASAPGHAVGAAVFHWHELDARSLRQWKAAIGG